MRLPILRTLSALAVAGSIGAGAPVTQKTSSALSVTLICVDDAFSCEAYASGGSGVYNFTWTQAYEYERDGAYSAATPACTDYIGGLYVRVTVTDSNGATATRGDGVNCNPF